jgi:hypothetical protein
MPWKKIRKNVERSSGAAPAAGKKAPPPSLRELTDDDLRFFAGDDEEPLTEELISKLMASGMPEKGLREMQEMGYRYNRVRNSFVGPSETTFFGDDD